MTQQRHRRRPGLFVFVVEITAEQGFLAKNAKEVRSDIVAAHAFRRVLLITEVGSKARKRRDPLKGMALLLVIEVLRVRQHTPIGADIHDLVRLGKRKVSKQDGIDEREYGAVDADAQRQSHDRD